MFRAPVIACNRPFSRSDAFGRETVFRCSSFGCPYCDSVRLKSFERRIFDDVSRYRYSYFITLTYSNEHLPLYHHSTGLVETSRNCHDGTTFRRVFKPVDSYTTSSEALDAVRSAPVVRFRTFSGWSPSSDISCVGLSSEVAQFVKRLRISISRSLGLPLSSILLSYLFVLEYGPRTHRPHYHGIVCFDDSRFVPFLSNGYVFKTWARCSRNKDVSQPVHNKEASAKYLSKYVSKLSSLLPLHSSRPFRPFVLTSRSPAFGRCAPVSSEFHSQHSSLSAFFVSRTSYRSETGTYVSTRQVPNSPFYNYYLSFPSFLLQVSSKSFSDIFNFSWVLSDVNSNGPLWRLKVSALKELYYTVHLAPFSSLLDVLRSRLRSSSLPLHDLLSNALQSLFLVQESLHSVSSSKELSCLLRGVLSESSIFLLCLSVHDWLPFLFNSCIALRSRLVKVSRFFKTCCDDPCAALDLLLRHCRYSSLFRHLPPLNVSIPRYNSSELNNISSSEVHLSNLNSELCLYLRLPSLPSALSYFNPNFLSLYRNQQNIVYHQFNNLDNYG